jgi:hypothetical protein
MPGSRCQPANSWLVLAAGWPGSGKSTLAAALAAEPGLPLPAKDEIKEALVEGLGRPETAAASQRLGRAAVPPDACDRVRAGCGTWRSPGSPSGAAGRGHVTGAAVTCAFTAMARIWRGCPGPPRSCRHGLAGLALAGCQCRLRAAVSPHRFFRALSGFFSNHTVLAGVSLQNRTVDLLLNRPDGFVRRRPIESC